MQQRADTAHSADTGLPVLLITRPGPGVVVLTLNRGAARNGLSLALIAAIEKALAELSADPRTGAIVLAANGPAFCAGHDLKELTAHRSDADGGRAFFDTTMTACARMMQAIVASPKPVIAAVHGIATAAGCQLVATCDLAVAGEGAKFCTPGVNIGLFCSTPMVALSRNVSRKRAMEMLLIGDLMSARDAETYGLVNRVVADDHVLATAVDYAKTIAAKSRAAIAVGKANFYRQLDVPLAEAYDLAAQAMVENMMIADAEEGICAFIEKRSPRWGNED